MEFSSIKAVVIFIIGQLVIFAIIKYFPFEYNTFDGATSSNGAPLYNHTSINEDKIEVRSYESQNLSGCTVSVVDHLPNKTLPGGTSHRCSHRILDEYLRDTHQFHGEGTWYIPTSGAPGNNIDYQPSICTFGSILKDKGALQECLKKNKIGKILVTGDSNGRKFKDGLLEKFQSMNYTCFKTRCSLWGVNESLKKDDTYFDVPGIEHQRLIISKVMFDRQNWAPTTYKCRQGRDNDTTASLEIEFIHTGKIDDTSLILSDVSSGIVFRNRLFRAESLLEYLLKYYYPHRTFPDVWFYTTPFHNMISGTSLQKLELDIDIMFRLLDIYLPKSTQVVLVSDATECMTDLDKQFSADFKQYSNVTLDERIHEMNQVLYSKLVPELSRHSNYHAFLDATRVACPLTCKWHADAAHMVPDWYNKMAEYNLDLVCNT